jgi:hypothetical protein
MNDNDDNTCLRVNNMFGRLLLSGALFIALTGAGLYTVYIHFAPHSVRFDARLLEPPAVLGTLLLLLVYFSADGLRLYFCIRSLGYAVPLRTVAKLVFINIFFSNITPMATGGGVAQIWYLHSRGIPVGIASAATTIRTMLAIVFIFTATPIFILTLKPLQNIAILDKTGPVLMLLILIYLGFFAIIVWRSTWLSGILSRIVSTLHRSKIIGDARHQRWQFKARREVLRFTHSFSSFLKAPFHLNVAAILCTAIFLLSLFSFPALLIHPLGYEVDYSVSIGLLVVTTFIMYFAPTPGAAGIAEGVFGAFFSTMLSADHLLLVILAWRFLSIYLGMLIGMCIMLLEIIKGLKVYPCKNAPL